MISPIWPTTSAKCEKLGAASRNKNHDSVPIQNRTKRQINGAL